MSKVKYTYKDLEERVEEMNKGKLTLSNQYGMIFLVNDQNEILLTLTDLVSKEERMKHA